MKYKLLKDIQHPYGSANKGDVFEEEISLLLGISIVRVGNQIYDLPNEEWFAPVTEEEELKEEIKELLDKTCYSSRIRIAEALLKHFNITKK